MPTSSSSFLCLYLCLPYLVRLAYLSVFSPASLLQTVCCSPQPRVPRLSQNVLAGLLGVTSLLWITISSPARVCSTSWDCLFLPLDDICQKIFANPFNVCIFVWNSLNLKSFCVLISTGDLTLLNKLVIYKCYYLVFDINPFGNLDILLPCLDTYL